MRSVYQQISVKSNPNRIDRKQRLFSEGYIPLGNVNPGIVGIVGRFLAMKGIQSTTMGSGEWLKDRRTGKKVQKLQLFIKIK